MKIGSIGYNYSHGSDFVMDRPNGPGCWLFLLVKTPAYFRIGEKEYNASTNSYVIFSPQMPCLYHSTGDTYTDDWIYFSMEDDSPRRFEDMGIKIDEPVYLGSVEELSQMLHIITYEFYSGEIHREDIVAHYTEIFLLKLSRQIKSKNYSLSSTLMEKNHKFTQLRTRIYTMPDMVGCVDDMAAELGMSRSNFQHTYKKMFGVSVITDVISGRLDRAKRLLCATNLTVKEIAERCGYENEYNFMRQFKSRFGKTPSGYRKNL